MQAGVWCYYTAVASLFHPSSFLLPTGTSCCRLSTSHPHLRSCNNILAATQRRCDSRHASQRPLRHTQDPPTPVCQVPPTSLKQGIWLLWWTGGPVQVRSRNNEGNFPKTEIERTQEKKTRSSHYHTHTNPINHSSHLTLADTLPSPPPSPVQHNRFRLFLFIFSIDALCALAWPICKIERSSA